MIGSSEVVSSVGSYQNDLYLKIHSFEEAREEPYTDYYIWRDAKDLDPSKKRLSGLFQTPEFFKP